MNLSYKTYKKLKWSVILKIRFVWIMIKITKREKEMRKLIWSLKLV